MSCKAYLERLSEALLHGDAGLGEALAAHVRTCAKCAEFYEAQKRLLGAMDLGVRAMVNEEMPVSLLPGVRARMETVQIMRQRPRFSWAAGLAVVCVVLFAGGTLQNKHWRSADSAGPLNVASAGKNVPAPTIPTAKAEPSRGGKRWEAAIKKPKPPSESLPEVIVLPEEREAFARFIAEAPLDRENAADLAHTAHPGDELPMDIALL
ncbi:MAG: hypothetical protein K6T80_02200, partial [Firmicutes bacterium]|nr:hypothetical protein [Bacillota bacterium]